MLSDKTLLYVLRDKQRVALWGDLIRGLAVALLVLMSIGLIRYYTFLGHNMFTLWHMNDFGKFYYSTRAFLSGGDMYGPNPATTMPITTDVSGYFGNMNPPHFHLLLLPLARLEPLPAMILWASLSTISLIASFRIIGRELQIRWAWKTIGWAVFGTIACAATGIVIVTGQVTFLLMLPMTVAWASARRGRWERAAVWLGILASIKPFLAIFLPYLLLKREWRSAIVMVTSAIGCVVAGIAVFGAANYAAWMRALSSVDWAWAPMNASIEGLLTRALRPTPMFIPIAHAEGVIKPLSLLAALLVLVTTFQMLRFDRSVEATDRTFAVLILIALLISPLGWIYYIWLLAGPVLAIWSIRRPSKSIASELAQYATLIGLAMPLFVTVIARNHALGGVTFGSLYLWTLLGLFLAVVLDSRTSRQNTC